MYICFILTRHAGDTCSVGLHLLYVGIVRLYMLDISDVWSLSFQD